MKIPYNNLSIYKKSAQNLKLKTEIINDTKNKKVLLISDEKKFLLASSNMPGYYPNVTRWNAFFSNSKMITQKLLKRVGYSVITSKEVRVSDFTSLKNITSWVLEKKHNYPVIVKPDKGFRGQGIVIAENDNQLKKATQENYRNHKDFMIQPILDQDEYRILVVNNKVELIHSKANPSVRGDGKSTIMELLREIPAEKKDEVFIAWQYRKNRVSPKTKLAAGDTFEYHLTKKPTTTYYKTEKIPTAIKQWALKLAKDVSSPVVGIDVFISGEITDTTTYTIIELNSNPGLDYLIPYCNDKETPYRIFEKVLNDYFREK